MNVLQTNIQTLEENVNELLFQSKLVVDQILNAYPKKFVFEEAVLMHVLVKVVEQMLSVNMVFIELIVSVFQAQLEIH